MHVWYMCVSANNWMKTLISLPASGKKKKKKNRISLNFMEVILLGNLLCMYFLHPIQHFIFISEHINLSNWPPKLSFPQVPRRLSQAPYPNPAVDMCFWYGLYCWSKVRFNVPGPSRLHTQNIPVIKLDIGMKDKFITVGYVVLALI